MALDLTPLAWDSEFFGVSIGRVDLTTAEPESVAELEDRARAEGIDCLYGFLDPASYETSHLVQTLGYRFVEASARFDLDPRLPVDYPATDSEVRRGTEADLDAVMPAVLRMAPWSRYAVDPRFGIDAARRMNRAWIERAARCTTDEFDLMVAENDSGITAFISRARHPHPIVDTVGTTAPGSGAARALINESRQWAGDQPLWGGWIAARNVNSYRFVEHCGYRVAEVRYIYHRWLDEGA